MRKTIITIYLIACAVVANGQITGMVHDRQTGETIQYASVYWAGSTVGTTTDWSGNFAIPRSIGHNQLVASVVGYMNDTITITNQTMVMFHLRSAQIEAVIVEAAQRGSVSPISSTQRLEGITATGLAKLACCTLAESFENSATMSTGYSDAVSGARQIKLLGLAGIYTQIMDETRPIMRGVGSYYGLSYISGMWLEGIQIAKGVSSVQGGHESIAGEINLELRKPEEELNPYFFNAYLDNSLRTEVNAYGAMKLTDKVSTILLLNGAINPLETDMNMDGYLDETMGRSFSVANRWLFPLGKVIVHAGVRYVNDARRGGMTGENPLYRTDIGNHNFNTYIKAGIPVGREGQSSVALIADYDLFDSSGQFGSDRPLNRTVQNSSSLSLRYNAHLGEGQRLTFGATGRIDSYGRKTTTPYLNDEREGGVFAEYNLAIDTVVTVTVGARGDYSSLHGWFATPRAHLRLPLTDHFIFRASAGLGYRTANPINDNLWALATNRTITIANGLERGVQERSATYGGSLQWLFHLGDDDAASWNFDVFRTEFFSQLVADQESGTGVDFYMSPRRPTTTTFQTDFTWTPFTGFDVMVAFRYNDARMWLQRADNSVVEVERPLTDRYKGVLNLAYATKFRRWVFDFTAQINGPSRVPILNYVSPTYPMFFAQVSHKITPATVLYVGVENIGNYTQPNPIVGGDNPSAPDFNASLIWGPLMGRKIYAGVRINF